MEELKAEATELGLDFKGNISKVELTNLIDEAKNVTAEDSKPKKIKVKITPRDSEEFEGYVGFNGYNAQYQFDEEVEMPENVVEFIKSRGGNQYDKNGKARWLSRYIVEQIL